MFFWLKKLLGYWIMPVPACLTLLVAGLILLRSSRRARLGKRLLTIGIVGLLVLSNKLVSGRLVRPLETIYPAIPELPANAPIPSDLAECRFVAVLGAGNGNTPGVAALDQLSVSARARITEAVRVLRVLPGAKLLVSGPRDGYGPSHATMLEQAAISLGIDPTRIQRIELARDTEDEANAVRQCAGTARVALVTSAWHMPRSAALFRSAGVSFVACPTDYVSHWDGRFHPLDLVWDVESIERSSCAVREYVGYTWIWLRGKTRPPR